MSKNILSLLLPPNTTTVDTNIDTTQENAMIIPNYTAPITATLIADRSTSTWENLATITVNGTFLGHCTTGAPVCQMRNVVHSPNADGTPHSYTYERTSFNSSDADYRIKTLVANGEIKEGDEVIVRNDRHEVIRITTIANIRMFHGAEFSLDGKRAPAHLSSLSFKATDRKFGREEAHHYSVNLTRTRIASANGIGHTFVVCRDTMGLAWG